MTSLCGVALTLGLCRVVLVMLGAEVDPILVLTFAMLVLLFGRSPLCGVALMLVVFCTVGAVPMWILIRDIYVRGGSDSRSLLVLGWVWRVLSAINLVFVGCEMGLVGLALGLCWF